MPLFLLGNLGNLSIFKALKSNTFQLIVCFSHRPNALATYSLEQNCAIKIVLLHIYSIPVNIESIDHHHFLIIINTYQWLGIYNTDVTITRPAIFFSVNKSYQFMAAPHEHHWYVVKWTMHYLSGIIAYGLLLIPATLPH